MNATPDADRKTLILTGASRGIGHATVKRFSTAGWRVITCSRQPFSEDCPWDAGPEDHIVVDLASSEDTHKAIAQMKEKLKAQGSRLHALVNNAAISPKKPGGARLNTLETSEHDWKTVFQINFFAPVMLARGLMDELVAAKGAVVNVTSIAGSRRHPFAGAAYSTSKAALAALTREMAGDFGPHGVRVNAISPGYVLTEALQAAIARGDRNPDDMTAQSAMGRLVDVSEVADAAGFLLSDAARAMRVASALSLN